MRKLFLIAGACALTFFGYSTEADATIINIEFSADFYVFGTSTAAIGLGSDTQFVPVTFKFRFDDQKLGATHLDTPNFQALGGQGVDFNGIDNSPGMASIIINGHVLDIYGTYASDLYKYANITPSFLVADAADQSGSVSYLGSDYPVRNAFAYLKWSSPFTNPQIAENLSLTARPNSDDRFSYFLRDPESGVTLFSISGTVRTEHLATLSVTTEDSQPPVDGVPEPATWAMMLIGCGVIGGTMRRRQKQLTQVHPLNH